MTIAVAKTERDIRKCYPIMKQLRTHLSEAEFLERVQRQRNESGYVLSFSHDAGRIKAVAGFRISECLSDGKYIYIDDLVTDNSERSKGHGGKLFDWIVNHARKNGCVTLELDSRVDRFDAHRFYLRQRMMISCHHFSLELLD